MEIFAIVMISLLGAVLVGLGLLILFGVLSFRLSLSAKNIAGKIAETNVEINSEKYLIDHSWWDKVKQEVLDIKSYDDLTLYAHFIDKKSDKLVILVHGYGGSYKDMNSFAQLFLKRGYSVLAVECRAHGNSGGNMVGMGWFDRLDIKKWVEAMVQRNPNYKICLFGQSMGASAVCMALGEQLPNNVVCAISDCGFDNVYRQFYHVCRGHLKFLSKPTLYIFNLHLKRTRGFDIKRADAVKQLKKSKVPILFIHGKADEFVPVEMCYRLSGAVPESRREVLLIENAGHIMSYATAPKEYSKKVDKFLSKYYM